MSSSSPTNNSGNNGTANNNDHSSAATLIAGAAAAAAAAATGSRNANAFVSSTDDKSTTREIVNRNMPLNRCLPVAGTSPAAVDGGSGGSGGSGGGGGGDASLTNAPTTPQTTQRGLYFAVKLGMYVRNCIFLTWDDCRPHVEHFPLANYATFRTLHHAETYLETTSAEKAQRYAESFGCSTSGRGSAADQETAASVTATALDNLQNGRNNAPMTLETNDGSLESTTDNASDRFHPGTVVTAMVKQNRKPEDSPNDASEHWTKESYSQDPPSSHWWSIYFFLYSYRRIHKSMTLDPNTVRELRDKESKSFTLDDFWMWCDSHATAYQQLSSEQRLRSIKVKRLQDLGFDFEAQYSQAKEKIQQGEQDDSSRSKSIQPPAKRQKMDRPLSAKANWERMYDKAIAYRKAHGNFDVPSDTSDVEEIQLRKWIQAQQATFQSNIKDGRIRGAVRDSNNKYLTEAKIRKLTSLKFPFQANSATENPKLRQRKPHPKWLEMLERLKEYHQVNNSFEIEVPDTPGGQEPNENAKAVQDLKQWLREQNQHYANMLEGRRSHMTDEKVQLLSETGYKLQYVTCAENLKQLKAYMEENGTREIPTSHPLSKWARKVKGQLQRLDEGKQGVKLTLEQAQQLKDLGFVSGNIRAPVNEEEEDRMWNEMYEKLKAYKNEHGDCLISTTNFTDPLVKWVMAQRRYYRTIEKKGKSNFLNARRLQKLHEIGFVFRQKKDGYKSFEERVEELRAFKGKHGHLRIPTNQPGPGAFVAHCRDQYRLAKKGKKHSMSDEKFRILLDIGFEFQVGKSPTRNFPKHTWEERFQQLLQYKEKYGNTIVPQCYTSFNNLGQWVKGQRDNYRLMRKGSKSPMTAEMALKLSDIGFVWDANALKRKRNDVHDREESEDEDEPNHYNNRPSLPVVALAKNRNNNNELSNGIRLETTKLSKGGDASSKEGEESAQRLYNMYYP